MGSLCLMQDDKTARNRALGRFASERPVSYGVQIVLTNTILGNVATVLGNVATGELHLQW